VCGHGFLAFGAAEQERREAIMRELAGQAQSLDL
jgi:hypothetical protein